MLLAVIEDGFGLLFVYEAESEMGRHVTEGKRQHRLRFHAVIHAVRIGVRHEVRQRRFRYPIRLTPLRSPSSELETDLRSQVEQLGIGGRPEDGPAERVNLTVVLD